MKIYQIDYLVDKTAFPVDYIEINASIEFLSKRKNVEEIRVFMKNKYKLTDIIEGGIQGRDYYFVSEKFKNIFDIADELQLEFFPVEVIHKNNVYNYYLLNFIEDNSKHIDFKKSIFFLVNKISGKEIMELKINSLENFNSKRITISGDKNIKFENDVIRLSPQFDQKSNIYLFDLFLFGKMAVTEKVKKMILENKITGIRFVGEKEVIVNL